MIRPKLNITVCLQACVYMHMCVCILSCRFIKDGAIAVNAISAELSLPSCSAATNEEKKKAF